MILPLIFLKENLLHMLNDFTFKITVQDQWIDYNHHMQDAYYGLVFSYAVDHFQDVVGFDKRYRSKTGCTIFVIEDHKFYLSEVKLGSKLVIKTTLVDTDKEKFILHSQMLVDDKTAAVSEMLQAHVNTIPTPKIRKRNRTKSTELTVRYLDLNRWNYSFNLIYDQYFFYLLL